MGYSQGLLLHRRRHLVVGGKSNHILFISISLPWTKSGSWNLLNCSLYSIKSKKIPLSKYDPNVFLDYRTMENKIKIVQNR